MPTASQQADEQACKQTTDGTCSLAKQTDCSVTDIIPAETTGGCQQASKQGLKSTKVLTKTITLNDMQTYRTEPVQATDKHTGAGMLL